MSRKKSEHTDTRQNTSAAMRPRKCKPCKVLNIEWNIAASVCVKNMFVARQRKNIYTNRDQFCTEICFTYTLQFFLQTELRSMTKLLMSFIVVGRMLLASLLCLSHLSHTQ